MNVFKWLKQILGFDEADFDDIEVSFDNDNPESIMESLSKAAKRRRNIDIDDVRQREEYVKSCCEVIATTNLDIKTQQVELKQINERLSDLEEIESLPPIDKNKVRVSAKKIVALEREELEYERPVRRITETQYRDMEKIEDDVPDILEKMRKDEDYQMLVRRDLNLLEGEKGAVAYQRKEERTKAKNSKNFIFLAMIAAIMASILLLVLQKGMKLDVKLGFVILAAVFAISVTIAFVLYQNAQVEITRQNRKLNRAISIQNTVKIKYVNITNVLDYNYSKYKVMNSYELSYLYDKYREEKAARMHDSEMTEKLDEARKNLYQILKHYHINDPSLWVYQPGVLVFADEEKELRRTLIVSRQKLKKGIDFEKYNLDSAKAEIESLIRDYPKYEDEVMAIMRKYIPS